MSILVYNPGIRCLIDSTVAGSTIDVSDDIQSGTVTLTENGLHTMQINLLNKNRKYDHAFSPNDRFVIYMKRINELVVMTGYLNTVPYVTAWPRSVPITGYCANKRGLFHFWDPGTPASFDLMTHLSNGLGSGANSTDSGLSRMAEGILTTVAGYDPAKIHIGQLPGQWLRSITQVFDAVESQVGNEFATLGGANSVGTTNPVDVIGGTPPNVPAGAELPTQWGMVTPGNAPTDIQNARNSQYWIAMQWPYLTAPNGANTPGVDATKARDFLRNQKVIISTANGNKGAVVKCVGWGPKNPNNSKDYSFILSPKLMSQLGLNQGDDVNVAYVYPDSKQYAIGPYNPKSTNLVKPPQVRQAGAPAPGSTSNNSTPYSTGSATGSETVTGPPAVAANWAKTNAAKGLPYHWGGGHPYTTQVPPPGGGWDCSGLCGSAWLAAGVTLAGGYGTAADLFNECKAQSAPYGSVTKDQIQPGDLIFYAGGDGTLTEPGHVTMYVGDGQMAEALDHTTPSHVVAADFEGSGRGGISGMGRPNYSGSKATGTLTTGGNGSQLAGNGSGSGNSLITIWDWYGQGIDPLSAVLSGPRALMNDQPILPFWDLVIKASMRSWCAAPNGDMIAWFPDYFDIYGTLGKIDVTSVELEDFTIRWSDASLVTHQFTAGTSTPTILGPTPGGPVEVQNIVQTMGIATVQFPQIVETLFNLKPGESGSDFAQKVLDRFGVRPNFTPMETIVSQNAEFWYAIYLFQLNWASQFFSTVPITFMPECYPGMLLRAKEFGFQAYITQVTHTFDLSNGGGFKTELEVIAPSATDGSGLYSLVKGSYGGMM